jgi:hypothetical protein
MLGFGIGKKKKKGVVGGLFCQEFSLFAAVKYHNNHPFGINALNGEGNI